MLAGKNKGESLIEAIVAIFISSISIIFLSSAIGVNYKSSFNSHEIMDRLYRIDAIKKSIICNLSYDDIKYNFTKKKYLDSNLLKEDRIKYLNINDFMDDDPKALPKVEVEVSELENEIILINVKYIFEKGRNVSNIFYKGNYEEVIDIKL